MSSPSDVAGCPDCGRPVRVASNDAVATCPDCSMSWTHALPVDRSPADDLVGRTVDGYRLVGRIGEGGMGVLYRAVDPNLEREFAIKVVLGELARRPGFPERFRAEVRLASRIDDPAVVPILRYGELDGRPYCVMPFVEGQDLAGYTRQRGPLPLDRALAILAQAARGLAAIHRGGIVHRDVKPHNLLIDAEGRVRVTDFGLARDTRVDGYLTATGAILGTPAFMSPEQALGDPVDVRSDVYSLGLTFYFLLAAEAPFTGPSALRILDRQRSEPLPDPSERNPSAVGPAIDLLRSMTAKDPEQRPASMDAVLDSLRQLAPSGPPRARRSRPDRRPIAAGLVVAVVVVLIAVIGFLVAGGDDDLPTPVAVTPPEGPAPGPGPVDDPPPDRDPVPDEPVDPGPEIAAFEEQVRSLVAAARHDEAAAAIDGQVARSDRRWQEAVGRARAALSAACAAELDAIAAEVDRIAASLDPSAMIEALERLPGRADRLKPHLVPGEEVAHPDLGALESALVGVWIERRQEVVRLLVEGRPTEAARRLDEALAWGSWPGLEEARASAGRLPALARRLDASRRSMWRALRVGDPTGARAAWSAFDRPTRFLGQVYPLEAEEAPIDALATVLDRLAGRLDEARRSRESLPFRFAGEAVARKRAIVEVERPARFTYREFQENDRLTRTLLELEPEDAIALAGVDDPLTGSIVHLAFGRIDDLDRWTAGLSEGQRDLVRYWARLIDELGPIAVPEVPTPPDVPDPPDEQAGRRARIEGNLKELLGPTARILDVSGDEFTAEVVFEFDDRAEADHLIHLGAPDIADGAWRVAGLIGALVVPVEWTDEVAIELRGRFLGRNNLAVGLEWFHTATGHCAAGLYGDRPGLAQNPPPGAYFLLRGGGPERHLGRSPLRFPVKRNVSYTLVVESSGGQHRVTIRTADRDDASIVAVGEGPTTGRVQVVWGLIDGFAIERLGVRGRLADEAVKRLDR